MKTARHGILRLGCCVLALVSLVGQAHRAIGDDLPQASSLTSPMNRRTTLKVPLEERLRKVPDGHPLKSVLRYAHQGYNTIDQDVRDYACVLVKRERIDGKLSGYEHIRVKLRHERIVEGKVVDPFSVYLKYLKPTNVRGREVIYVHGQNAGDLIARRGGRRLPNMTLLLEPTGRLAMEGNRYPIMEIGIKNLVVRLIEVIENKVRFDECDVAFYRDAKVNGRSCTQIQVTNNIRRKDSRFQNARVFVDNELQVPIYYASYGWPERSDAKPVLLEEYAYTNIQLNAGLADRDFDHTNPDYQFQMSASE